MFKQTLQRGFTLIELLVVIAIIALLATVIFGSIGTARQKGADGAILSSVNGIRNEAEIKSGQADGSVDYSDVCTDISAISADVDSKNGTGNVVCTDAQDTWVFAAQLVADDTQFACADSTGYSGIASGTIAGTETDTACSTI